MSEEQILDTDVFKLNPPDIKTFNCADAAIGQRFLSWPGRSVASSARA
jgi:hypothetical protein